MVPRGRFRVLKSRMWENPLQLDLASQKDEEDLDQLDLNECVIDIDQ